jgi:hypothetical protein
MGESGFLKLVVSVALAAALSVPASLPASADVVPVTVSPTSPGTPCGSVTCDGSNGSVGVNGNNGGGSPGGGGGASGQGGGSPQPVDNSPQPVVKVYHCGPRLPPQNVVNAIGPDCMDASTQCPLAPGQVEDTTLESVETITTDPDGQVLHAVQCDVPVGGAALPQVTAAEVEQEAIRFLPTGVLSTTGAVSLVNLKTVFWVETPVSQAWGPVSIVGSAVTIKALLVSVHWNFGDGTTAVTADPGRRYVSSDPCDALCAGYFGHVYTSRTGSVTVSAQSYWTASFSVNGGPFVALPAPVAARPAPPVTVTIRQAHSQLVSG